MAGDSCTAYRRNGGGLIRGADIAQLAGAEENLEET